MRNNESEIRPGRVTRLVAIILFSVILLSVAFGAGIGIMNAVDDSLALVRLEGVRLRDGEVRYLASVYKATYMGALRTAGVSGVSDTVPFWNSTAPDGKSYGEKLDEGFAEYLRGMLAASRIYYQYANYTSYDRAIVEAAVRDKLKYSADGSVEKFNEMNAKYGFTYDDFASASAFIYRAERAKLVIYGEGGASLSVMPEECVEYIKEYTRVKVMFVRRFDRINDKGETVALSADEINAKAEKIDTIREYIANAKAGLDNAMSPDAFDLFLRDDTFSDSDEAFFDTGYYLHPAAEQTAYFEEAFPEVYEAAMTLAVGDFCEAEWESGVAFIYRLDPEDEEYKNEDNLMLSDFYSDLSDRLYPELLSEVGAAAEFTELYGDISVVDIPANTVIVANFKEK